MDVLEGVWCKSSEPEPGGCTAPDVNPAVCACQLVRLPRMLNREDKRYGADLGQGWRGRLGWRHDHVPCWCLNLFRFFALFQLFRIAQCRPPGTRIPCDILLFLLVLVGSCSQRSGSCTRSDSSCTRTGRTPFASPCSRGDGSGSSRRRRARFFFFPLRSRSRSRLALLDGRRVIFEVVCRQTSKGCEKLVEACAFTLGLGGGGGGAFVRGRCGAGCRWTCGG